MPLNQRLKKTAVLLLKIGVAAGLIAWLMHKGQLDLRRIGGTIRDHPAGMLLALLMYNGCVVLTANRWRMLLIAQGIPATRRDCVGLGYIGAFFSTFLPGGTGGDIVKAIYIARDSHKKAEAVTTVFLDRVFGLYCMVTFAAAAILFRAGVLWHASAEPAVFGLTQPQCLVIVVVGVFLAGTLGLAVVLSSHWRRLTHFLLDRVPVVGPVLKRVYEAVYLYRGHKGVLLKFVAYSLASHTMIVVSLFIVGYSFGDRLDPVANPMDPIAHGGPRALNYFFLILLGLVVNGLPITPAGIGAFEVALPFLFGALLLPGEPNLGSNIALTGHLIFLLTNQIGLVFFLKGRRRVAEAVAEAAQASGSAHENPAPLASAQRSD